MQITINIDEKVLRKALRLLCTVAVAAGIAYPVLVFGKSIGSLVTFSPGTKISAADVNANFAAVQLAVNDNDARIGDLTQLQTTAKTTLVAAMNEVRTSAAQGPQGPQGPPGPAGSTTFAGMTDKLTDANITDNTISGAKITDGTIATAKLQTAFLPTAGGTLSGNLTFSNDAQILAPRIENSATQPVAPAASNAGRLWFDTTNNVLRFSDGTSWLSTRRKTYQTTLSGDVALVDFVYTDIVTLNFTKASAAGDLRLTYSGAISTANSQTFNLIFLIDGNYVGSTVNNWLWSSANTNVLVPLTATAHVQFIGAGARTATVQVSNSGSSGAAKQGGQLIVDDES